MVGGVKVTPLKDDGHLLFARMNAVDDWRHTADIVPDQKTAAYRISTVLFR
jgi:hypothetical protein